MRRPFLILAAMLLAGATVFLAGQRLAARWCAEHMAHTTDDLDWLRIEFHLSDADLARVRKLHDGYLPVCGRFCERIETKRQELHAALDSGTSTSSGIERILIEIGTLRAQCQSAMLEHFREVSEVMPPEQGRRYLSEMQRLTLGFHEQIERSMRGDPANPHGHH